MQGTRAPFGRPALHRFAGNYSTVPIIGTVAADATRSEAFRMKAMIDGSGNSVNSPHRSAELRQTSCVGGDEREGKTRVMLKSEGRAFFLFFVSVSIVLAKGIYDVFNGHEIGNNLCMYHNRSATFAKRMSKNG